MKIQAVKGTRDFYPPQMRLHNWILEGWKEVSLRNGFEEYDGPIFEHLKMYEQKSGEEIAEQLFSFEDRGGRGLAIRPEITPTLARMVNQRINALPKPIKWFSVPRVCRAERPQKGRLREFYQWNIDIIGVEDIVADAEVILCSVDYLRQTGLTEKDIVVKISSRKMLGKLLEACEIEQELHTGIYAALDKKAKIPEDAFEKLLEEKLPDQDKREKLLEIFATKQLSDLQENLQYSSEAAEAIDELIRLFSLLKSMGISEYCEFDIGIVRGLAYYTGTVFEIHDREGELRAICGGGRFDSLLKDFGGPSIPATGMGMGDCVLEILLREKGIISEEMPKPPVNYFIAVMDDELVETAAGLAAKLRLAGLSAEFSYKKAKMKKLMKQASETGAEKSIILGGEYIENKQIVLKNMETSEQRTVDYKQFCDELKYSEPNQENSEK
ncbi:histidine--tRNA ligase [Sedimentisphaera salicampi]|uniref:Histidine--tRNA ligase n=1 Tax=Sedimentisphaera salicampi TaxID=1941349 RepID=A0A1W6LQ75_9BACT|nr:histidine--tRNA ligase [Sedimentisphaera salicampi]ARN57924.1 Histidine--tRNA ligase [Sedimentisphaera salicampi]OXU14092.1 Histidine--tRNA ligase [Sedimentisphaera salicampi]